MRPSAIANSTAGDPRPEAAAQPRVIEANGVSLVLHTAGEPVSILSGINLTVYAGEFVAVVGPSGSGKTMFLNTLAGLEQHTSGSLTVLGEPPRAGRPEIGYAMARDALLPWR